MSSSSGIPPIRDHLYQEGIILADYVVTEFINSQRVSDILHHDKKLKAKLFSRLKDKIAQHRAEALMVLDQCEFIDRTAPEINTASLQKLVSANAPPAAPSTPTQVSKSALDLLASQPLTPQKFAPRRPGMTVASPQKPTSTTELKIEIPELPAKKQKSISPSKFLARSGLFSGLIVPDETPIDSSDDEASTPPSQPSELRLRSCKIMESDTSVDIYGVLDKDRIDECSNIRQRKGNTKRLFSKRHRRAPEGFFQKDGSYHAIAYGGFVHLCGGALEWPFKIAEVAFVDFFNSRDEKESPNWSTLRTEFKIRS